MVFMVEGRAKRMDGIIGVCVLVNSSGGYVGDGKYKCIDSNLLRSDLNVPPYLGLLPIRSMISGMQEANTAYIGFA